MNAADLEIEPERVWRPASEALLDWGNEFHDLLLRDELRMTAYRQAIYETVRPGSVVVDVGVGTGVLSQWALRAGAARVYGIEMNSRILDAAVLRIANRERFFPIHGRSDEVELPERVDVVLSEILGNIADNESCVPIIKDARLRFLRTDGLMLPYRVESYLVPVSVELAHRRVREQDVYGYSATEERPVDPFDLYYDVVLPADRHLASPRVLQSFEFGPDDAETYTVEIGFPVHRAGVFTGFKGYFVASLSRHVTLDISGDGVGSGMASRSWKHCFLPIAEPVTVRAGDQILVRFERARRGGRSLFGQSYAWTGAVRRDDRVLVEFSHRTGVAESTA